MNGVLVIDKPAGLTSHDVVNRVRRILQQRASLFDLIRDAFFSAGETNQQHITVNLSRNWKQPRRDNPR